MLTPLIEKGRVPHAILLAGQSKKRLEEEAGAFLAQFAEPADRFEYRPEGKIALHTVERMRELKEEVYLPPYQGERKVFVLYEADRMWPQSSNALLKTFEEPSSTSYLVLTTSRREKILPTILSRCQTFWVAGKGEAVPLPEPVEALLAVKRYEDSRPFFKQVKLIAAEYEKFEDPLELSEAMGELFCRLEERFPMKRRFLDEARLKLERSTSVTAMLESLFIKLGVM